MSGPRILIVEDDPEIQEMLTFSLTRAGYQVTACDSGERALEHLDGQLPAALIVDWMLPGLSGVELVGRIRREELTRDIPLIMLTARGEEADKLKGFDSGVDDYLTKPFSPKELLARIKALIRRSSAPADGVLELQGLRLDHQAHRLSVGEEEVHLGPTEFRLLALLMTQPDRAFDRAALLDRVWGRGVYVEERTVDVHVLRLRRALKPHGLDQLVQTVRGVGYRFKAPS
ncbi:MAG: phosphate regulon transcriptional regulator PhoB [Pseudomonadales bacterium]